MLAFLLAMAVIFAYCLPAGPYTALAAGEDAREGMADTGNGGEDPGAGQKEAAQALRVIVKRDSGVEPVKDVPLGKMALEIGDGSNTCTVEDLEENIEKETDLEYDSTKTYSLDSSGVTSENYQVTAGGSVDTTDGTPVFVVTVTGLTPKAEGISGKEEIKALVGETYDLSGVWSGKADDWKITDGSGAQVETEADGSCTVTASKGGENIKLAAEIGGDTVAEKTVKVVKNDTTLSVSADAPDSWKKEFTVTLKLLAGNEPLQGKTIRYSVAGTDYSGTTNDKGEIGKKVKLDNWAQTVSIQADFAGDDAYKAATAQGSYNPKKEAGQVALTREYTEQDPLVLTYGTDAVTEAFTLQYEGSELSRETLSEVLAEPGDGDVLEANVDKDTKTLTFSPKKASEGPVKVQLSMETDNYSFKKDVYVRVDPLPLVIVDGSIAVSAPEKETYTNTKIYDAGEEVDVKASLQAADGLSVTAGAKQEIEDWFKEVVFYNYASGLKDVREDVQKDAQVKIATQTFIFAPKDVSYCKGITDEAVRKNYTVKKGEKAENVPLTIEKRTLHLVVADDERPFRSLAYTKPLQELVSVVDRGDDADDGFAGSDSAKMEGFVYPKVIDVTAAGLTEENVKTNDEAKCDAIPNMLVLDTATGNATGNYVFDFETYKKGTLTISAEKGGEEYVAVDNGASIHAWETVRDGKPARYFGRKAEIQFELSGGYNKIYLADGTDITDRRVKTETLGLAAYMSGSTSEASFYLKREDPGTGEVLAQTEPFRLSFLYDPDAPKCTKIAFGVENRVISDLAASITFGIYDKKQIVADIAFEDAHAGVKDWSYYVAETDRDGTYKALLERDGAYEELLEQTVFQPGTANYRISVGTLSDGQSLEEGNNYVVFVKVADYVGNAMIYGSNGVVLENFHDISVSYTEKAAQGTDRMGTWDHVTYYSGGASLVLKAEENASQSRYYSGLEKMTYVVSRHYGDGRTVTDREKTAVTKATEDHAALPAFPQNVTLAELQQYCTITKTLDFADDPSRSQVITVSAEANDHAGNAMAHPVRHTIVLDTIRPAVTSSCAQVNNRGAFLHDIYANSSVTYTVAVKERFLHTLRVSINGVPYTLAELEAQKGRLGIASVTRDADKDIAQTTDETVYHFSVTFAADGEYTVQTAAADAAGNSGSDAPFRFVVDTVRPKLELTYTACHTDGRQTVLDPSKGRAYADEAVSYVAVTAVMTERNFAPGDAGLAVKATDSRKRDVPVDDYAAAIHGGWTNKGYVSASDDRYVYELSLPAIRIDANYDFTYRYTDLAGNALETVQTHRITLDRARPEGSVTVEDLVNGTGTKTWEKLLHVVSFGFFGKNRVRVSMTSTDATAGVASAWYLTSPTALSRSSLAKRTDWKAYKKKKTFKADRYLIVYEKIADKAGNVQYISTGGIIVDHSDPGPVVKITPSAPGWGKGVYSGKDNTGFSVSVTDPSVKGVYAGLKKITYQIVNGTSGYTETGTLAELKKSAHRQRWTGHVKVDPARFYSNDVRITVTAEDWSANSATSQEAGMKVDNKAPVVQFSFDRGDVQNGKYFKNDKQLTITVDERNFDESYSPKVTSSAGGGYRVGKWTHRGETHTAVVTFSGDSDYTVSYNCYDLAGNRSNTEDLQEFTVDKTVPSIQVAYDNRDAQNGKYYKAARTATVTVTEHNFDPAQITVDVTASAGGVPKIGGWSGSGDTHTAKISFSHDADYTFSVSGVDLAGNSSAKAQRESYTVDLTAPEITFSGVKDKSANNGTVAPVVRIRDTNFAADQAEVTLTGAERGAQKVDQMASFSSDASGMTVSFKDFAGGMDDIYTLACRSVDKAGNESMAAIRFSVNRDGSAYEISEDTQELVDKGYTNRPQDITVTEVNADELALVELSYSLDGKVVTLKEGTDYTVEKSGGEDQWKQYIYRIRQACFEAEGAYVVNIYSEDAAHNVTTNKSKTKTLAFTVDKTAPTMVVANLADGGRYSEETHAFTLNVKDNILLDYVETYLNGERIHTYRGDELEASGGEIHMDISSSNQYQTIALASCDKAGNISREVYDPETNEPAEASYRVLVTANRLVQFVNNRPLFIGSILLAAAAICLIVLLLRKMRAGKKGE